MMILSLKSFVLNLTTSYAIFQMEMVAPAKTVPKETIAKVVTEEVMMT